MEFEEFKDLLMHQRAIRLFDTSQPVDVATSPTDQPALCRRSYNPGAGGRTTLRRPTG